jgi:acyl-CoA synthetase (AMP-forming)/AMP-acid ligase II
MIGHMQDWPLLVSRLIEHAEREHGTTEIVTNTTEGGERRTTWAKISKRSRQLAQALEASGLARGARVGTLAWNSDRHLESWFGISGAGYVCHTLNPRLFDDQLVYIVNHAQDEILLFDLSFAALVARLAPKFNSVKKYVVMTDAAHMPTADIPNLCDYETFIAAHTGDYAWPQFDEKTPCGLCYTSGTTGNPKGVLYSHRSNVLHTMAACMPDAVGISAFSVILPIVPMFHANAWGIPYAAAAAGAKLVFNGPAFDAPTIHKMIIAEGVTMTAAVPTVWLAMLQYLDSNKLNLGSVQNVLIGGSACPRFMIEAFEGRYGVSVGHAWGMTETSPLGTVGRLKPDVIAKGKTAEIDMKCKQGRAIFGVEIKIADDNGTELPRDGKTFGRLLVRGPWIVGAYMGGDGGQVLDTHGFFDTGDVATIDPDGYMQITDRSKDVIKSGGEWISSIELENAAVGHPSVAEAAVIGVTHPKWDERPLLVVVLKPDASVTKAEMTEFLTGKIAKWWMPDDVVTVTELPHTATGKISKLELRKQFADYRLPGL